LPIPCLSFADSFGPSPFFVYRRQNLIQMLLSQVWGAGYGADAHYLHVSVGQLRHKIEPDPAHPRFILTVSGVGYHFRSED
jgi:DNA-binding response OmpR family regulator